MDNHDRADDDYHDDEFKDSLGNGNEREPSGGAAAQIEDWTETDINENDLDKDFSSDLTPPGFVPPISLRVTPSASTVTDNKRGAEILDPAPPEEQMPSPGLPMPDSLERPQGGLAGNYKERRSRRFSRIILSQRCTNSDIQVFTTFDRFHYRVCKRRIQEDGVPNSAGSFTSTRDSSLVAAENGLYTVQAELAPDGNEEESMMVAEVKSVTVKWYQRSVFRWILAFGLVAAVVVFVVLVVRPPSAASGSSLISPTPAPTSMPPEVNACNFLSIPNVTECQLIFEFSFSQWRQSSSVASITHIYTASYSKMRQ